MKYFLTMFCLAYINSTSAQTKAETEMWIVQKLFKYSKPYYHQNPIIDKQFETYDNLLFYFKDYYFVYSYTRSTTLSKAKAACTEKIPVYDIESVSFDDLTHTLYISTNHATILQTCLPDNDQQVTSVCNFYFVKGEVDLDSRLNKAFVYLKKFYQKPKSTEPF